jgi:hypothetical protein
VDLAGIPEIQSDGFHEREGLVVVVNTSAARTPVYLAATGIAAVVHTESRQVLTVAQELFP